MLHSVNKMSDVIRTRSMRANERRTIGCECCGVFHKIFILCWLDTRLTSKSAQYLDAISVCNYENRTDTSHSFIFDVQAPRAVSLSHWFLLCRIFVRFSSVCFAQSLNRLQFKQFRAVKYNLPIAVHACDFSFRVNGQRASLLCTQTRAEFN